MSTTPNLSDPHNYVASFRKYEDEQFLKRASEDRQAAAAERSLA